MKRKRSLLAGVVFGLITGWALGFLRLPFLEQNYSFLIGFVACLSVVLCIVLLLFLWNKNILINSLIGKGANLSDTVTINKTYTTIWVLITVFILLGGTISSILIYRQNELFDSRTQNLNQKISEQTDLVETLKNNNQVLLMAVFLDRVEDELNENEMDTLSAETIFRIAELSNSFNPYKYFNGDSLLIKKLSPERGQLLLGLSRLNIDSVSFAKILNGTNFAFSDLRKTDLHGLDLCSVDLRNANLWGANLKGAKLHGANLKRADLRWAEFNNAELISANLDGADLRNAKFIKADLSRASFQWADLSGGLLIEANLKKVNFLGAKCINTNLSNSKLSNALLQKVDLKGAILTNAELSFANVEVNWLDKLKENEIKGVQQIVQDYRVTEDTSGQRRNSKFYLKKLNSN